MCALQLDDVIVFKFPAQWNASWFVNFYTGVEFFQETKIHGLDACSTVHADRNGLPKNKTLNKQASLGKQEFKVAQKDDPYFLCLAGHQGWHGTV